MAKGKVSKGKVSKETIEKIKTLPRIPFETYKEMVRIGTVESYSKFKVARTIFFDESDGFFYYMNPYAKALSKCGFFKEEDVE